MRHRLPWALTLAMSLAGSRIAHDVGRFMAAAPAARSEVTEHLERLPTADSGSATLGVAKVLAPFIAIAVTVLVARVWTKTRGRSWRGVSPGWFLFIPAVAYVSSEVLERLLSGGSEALILHASHEPGFLLALALQVPFGAVACGIAFLLLAAARAIVAKARGLRLAGKPSKPTDVEPITPVAPTRWSCLVGSNGLRGPPVLLPS